MNSNEIELFKLLKEAVGLDYLIVPQVHFEKLIDPLRWNGEKKYAVGHVSRWSVDFGLFDLKTFEPVLAIELNGETHNNPETKIKDEEKGRHLKEAGIPLLIFQNHKLPNSHELSDSIRNCIGR
jgi:very-short-patch-repair endonuclease